MSRQAVIAGATGLVGSHCLPLLLAAPRYSNVLSIARRRIGVADLKLEQTDCDFDKLPARPVTDIFCALGTTIKKAGSKEAFRRVDYEYALRLAEWGVRNGAKQFLLVSSVDADPKSGNFYLQVKGDLEAAVNALAYEAVHIFRPSMLLGARAESRAMERIGQHAIIALEWALIGKLRKYHGMPASRLAAGMTRIAEQDIRGRFVYHYDQI